MAALTPLARRRRAIEVSGWGAPFRFLQPRNPCFWVYLAIVGFGLQSLVRALVSGAGAFGEAYVTAFASSGLFAALFLTWLHWADRWERTPGALVVAAFVAGGVAATFSIAVPGNDAVISLYTKLLGQPWAEDWKAGLTAPFVEETAKGAMFLLLMGLAPVVVRTAGDGLIVGAYVGLGFQILEDVTYGHAAAVRHFGVDQVDSVLDTILLRALSGLCSHALFTALFGAGLIYLIGTVAQPRRPVRGLLLMAAAMALHGVWDSAAALGGPVWSGLVLVATTIGGLTILYVAIRAAGGPERAFMRDVLAPEVELGTLTPVELAALTGRRRARRIALRRRAPGRSRRDERRALRAARALAFALAQSGGAETPAVLRTRAAVTTAARDPRRPSSPAST